MWENISQIATCKGIFGVSSALTTSVASVFAWRVSAARFGLHFGNLAGWDKLDLLDLVATGPGEANNDSVA
jgi:hypothetical protein